MTKIYVSIFNKTETRCTNCKDMMKVFNDWALDNVDTADLTTTVESVEENRDFLIKDLGALAAPVYVIDREGKTTVVSGNNPDILVDALNGDDDIWSDCSI